MGGADIAWIGGFVFAAIVCCAAARQGWTGQQEGARARPRRWTSRSRARPRRMVPPPRRDRAGPRVLCLTPEAVMGSVYSSYEGRLLPHRFRYWDRWPATLRRSLSKAEIVIGDWTGATPLGPEEIAVATHCDTILQPTAGYDSIDVASAAERSVVVTNVPGANRVAVAEWVLMAILSLLKESSRVDAEVRGGGWPMVEATRLGVCELHGR